MRKRKGLTLIEVVISMALIAMVAVVFLTIFGTGNSNIFRSGKRTENIYKIQENIDRKIKNYNGEENPEYIYVTIPGVPEVKKIPGKFITVKSENESGIEIEITTFVPNPK